MVGEGVEYVYTNSAHTNALCRVTSRNFIKEGQCLDYDKEKYREMLFEAAETVLGYFGFDRTLYGDPPRKNRKWWRELSNWRIQDIENERS